MEDSPAYPAGHLSGPLADGAELVVRRWQPSDVDAYRASMIASVEHLRPWMAWAANEPASLEEQTERVVRWSQNWEPPDYLYGMFVDGAVAGGCGLHERLGPRALEIGYWVDARHVRRGIATEASRVLTSAAFALPHIDLVEIHCTRANARSAAVPRTLGYSLVAETFAAPAGVDGTPAHLHFRVTRTEWTDKTRAGRDGDRAGSR